MGPPGSGPHMHMGMGSMGRAGPGAQMGHHRVMSPPLPSPAGGPMHGGPMGSMQSPQSRMHGGYGGGMMQQLLPLVKAPPSKRLEIVDPRRKSADAADSSGSSVAAGVAAAKGDSADSQAQFARRSEGGGAPGRPRSGSKAGSVSADGSAMLAL
jgi:hypothetical protein